MKLKEIELRIENFGAEKIFIALFLFFGVLICFVRPPYQLPDELTSFARVWQISEGKFLSPLGTQEDISKTLTANNQKSFGWKNHSPDAANEKMYTANIPVSLVPDEFIFDIDEDSSKKFSSDMLKNFFASPLNPDERESGLIPNTGVYSPPAYFPQVLTAWLARSLNLNAGAIYYLVNLSALFFVAACIFLSMKFLPEAKPLIFLLAMLPMFLIEAASSTIDSLTYGVCFLATAWLLSLRRSSEKLSRAEIFGLIFLSIMLACAKSVYGTILLLYFLIPPERVGSVKKFLLFGAAILFLNLFASLLWLKISVGMTGVELATSRHYLGEENIDVAAQKNFVMENPQAFFRATLNTLIDRSGALYYLLGFIGLFGVNSDFMLPIIFYMLYFLTLIFFALSNDLRLKFSARCMMIFAAAISAFAFFLIHFLKWTPLGANVLRGIQGRYFIPLAPMIFCALSILPPLRHKNLIALTAGICSGAITALTIFFTFY